MSANEQNWGDSQGTAMLGCWAAAGAGVDQGKLFVR